MSQQNLSAYSPWTTAKARSQPDTTGRSAGHGGGVHRSVRAANTSRLAPSDGSPDSPRNDQTASRSDPMTAHSLAPMRARCWIKTNPVPVSAIPRFRRPGRRASRPVGRVLSPRRSAGGGHPSGTAVAGGLVRSTREHRAGRPQPLAQAPRPEPRRPLDLAPGGVYQAARITPGAGGLLHHRFTLTPGTVPGGGLLSVALSRGSPRVGVTDHLALRSPDLPHPADRPYGHRPGAAARPARPPPGHDMPFTGRTRGYGPGFGGIPRSEAPHPRPRPGSCSGRRCSA
jgi:hypothetical protein